MKLQDIMDRYDFHLQEILSSGKLKDRSVSDIVASEFNIPLRTVESCSSYLSFITCPRERLNDFQVKEIDRLGLELSKAGIELDLD